MTTELDDFPDELIPDAIAVLKSLRRTARRSGGATVVCCPPETQERAIDALVESGVVYKVDAVNGQTFDDTFSLFLTQL